jgi:hypothetical protein
MGVDDYGSAGFHCHVQVLGHVSQVMELIPFVYFHAFPDTLLQRAFIFPCLSRKNRMPVLIMIWVSV